MTTLHLLKGNLEKVVAGLFLGIWNWRDIDKCFGGGGSVNMREKQIYIKKHLKKEKITLSRGWVLGSQLGVFTPRLGVKISLNGWRGSRVYV